MLSNSPHIIIVSSDANMCLKKRDLILLVHKCTMIRTWTFYGMMNVQCIEINFFLTFHILNSINIYFKKWIRGTLNWLVLVFSRVVHVCNWYKLLKCLSYKNSASQTPEAATTEDKPKVFCLSACVFSSVTANWKSFAGSCLWFVLGFLCYSNL